MTASELGPPTESVSPGGSDSFSVPNAIPALTKAALSRVFALPSGPEMFNPAGIAEIPPQKKNRRALFPIEFRFF